MINFDKDFSRVWVLIVSFQRLRRFCLVVFVPLAAVFGVFLGVFDSFLGENLFGLCDCPA